MLPSIISTRVFARHALRPAFTPSRALVASLFPSTRHIRAPFPSCAFSTTASRFDPATKKPKETTKAEPAAASKATGEKLKKKPARKSSVKKAVKKRTTDPEKRKKRKKTATKKKEKEADKITSKDLPPKRGVTPYSLWLKEYSSSFKYNQSLEPRQRIGAFGREVAKEWAALSETDKDRFKAAAVKINEERSEAIQKYLETVDLHKLRLINRKLKKTGKLSVGRLPKSRRRPPTAYLRYYVSTYKSVAETILTDNHRERIKLVSKEVTLRWKGLSDEDKKPYFEEYKKEKAAWDATSH